MTLRRRLLITIIGMLAASFIVDLLWRTAFDTHIPSYFSGLIGGIAALALWELLRPK